MSRLSEFYRHSRRNGLLWSGNAALYFVFSSLGRSFRRPAQMFEQRLARLELERGLVGRQTFDTNARVWNQWNWQHGGEEWTASPEWKQSVIDEILLPNVRAGSAILEIGPGAGRWTESIQKVAGRLVLADVSSACIELCKQRFAGCENIEYHVVENCALDFIDDASLDFVWSFDVFVHISPEDIEQYLRAIARTLRPGGRAVIHHAGEGGIHGGWRSSMTREKFAELVRERGLRIVKQFDAWGDGERFNVRIHRDAITIFERPAN